LRRERENADGDVADDHRRNQQGADRHSKGIQECGPVVGSVGIEGRGVTS
jgi:hypothetical protein